MQVYSCNLCATMTHVLSYNAFTESRELTHVQVDSHVVGCPHLIGGSQEPRRKWGESNETLERDFNLQQTNYLSSARRLDEKKRQYVKNFPISRGNVQNGREPPKLRLSPSPGPHEKRIEAKERNEASLSRLPSIVATARFCPAQNHLLFHVFYWWILSLYLRPEFRLGLGVNQNSTKSTATTKIKSVFLA
ncbi:hypothetical protein OUZ56_005840 [Daphnia magna]|uniref:Uncharacterized protein n=1 Tax=Daphnia magna TaxID=35525 RepID=A0ABQ9YTX6_9CRUS|nr:hypothetical protein OUZ56_005840 [Daphnia magna]